MNNFTKFLIGAGALVGIYFAATAGKLQALIIKAGEITKFKWSFTKPSSIFFTIYITNPNAKSLIFNEFYGTLKFNDTVISTINKKQEITIPGKGATISLTDIEARVSALDIIEKLVTKGEKILQLDGTITANGMPFPISQKMTLKV